NSLSAVNDDVLAFGQLSHQLSHEIDCRLLGRRHTTIGDRECYKLESTRLAQLLLGAQVQASDFVWCQERNNGIDAGAPPGREFVVKPVAAARARRYRQMPDPRPIDPVEFRFHLSPSFVDSVIFMVPRELCLLARFLAAAYPHPRHGPVGS